MTASREDESPINNNLTTQHEAGLENAGMQGESMPRAALTFHPRL
jgi:hypothetical protein